MAELNFRGKEFVFNHHLSVPFRPIVPQSELSIGEPNLDGNLIVHGDNLLALKSLLPNYAGRIKCIFIDPPYNTGEEGWCYNDNVNSPMIRDWLDANPITIEDTLRHDKWLSMMYPRLRLLHELLSDDGVIFVCIDYNESHRLRSLLEEIFGERNFRNEIIFRRGVKNVQSQFDDIHSLSSGHDTLYVFSKNSDTRLPKLLEISEEDQPGKWDTFWRGTDRATMRYQLLGETITEGQWRWKETRALQAVHNYEEYLNHVIESDEDISLDDYYFLRTQELGTKIDFVRMHEGTIQYYVPPRNYKLYSDMWMKVPASGNFTDFPHEKHVDFVRIAIDWITDETSIVLDSFAGSGTTGHAVLLQNKIDGGNRRFILVEMEDYANSTTAERIRRVISDFREENEEYDARFTYCELGDDLETANILSGENLPEYEQLGSLMFHLATNAVLDLGMINSSEYYLGETHSKHVWMLYQNDINWLKSSHAALTLNFAMDIAEHDPEKRHLVIAPARYVSQKLLDENNLPVEFIPLPYSLFSV